jgi:hypothetical protein
MWDQYTPAWVEVLRRCGYPLKVLVIDFETYFDDQTPESTIEKVTYDGFEILSCTFTLMDGTSPFADYDQHTQFIAGEESVERHIRYLQGECGDDLEQLVIVAQNLTFDATILWKRFGVNPRYMIDILGLARHMNSRQKNDLASLCSQYDLTAKGDTSQFEGVTLRTNRVRKPKGRGPKLPLPVPPATPQQIEALAVYNRNDNLREWELFTILLPQISNPQIELRTMQLTIELFTKPMLRVDFAKGEELIRLYNEQIDAALNAIELPHDLRYEAVLQGLPLAREHISGDKAFEALLVTALERAGDQPQRYYKVCKPTAARPNGLMPALAKPDPERELLLNHADPTVRALMKAHTAMDSWPLHIKRVRRIMDQAKANGGVLCVPLKYHGAHTGRDSGGEKINLQNLSSRGADLLVAIRHMLIPPEGYSLVIVDSAQVEARGCDWIAGQEDSLVRWAKNEDQYSIFASVVVGYKVRKPTKLDPPPIAKRLTWARNSIGKIGVLGCQFGMGGDKAEGYAQGAIDNDTAFKVVETYRRTHEKVVQFWRDVERSFAYTARYQRACSMPRGLRFDPHNEVGVTITLPNGRELHYPRVKFEHDAQGRERVAVYNAMEHKWEHTWGGTLTENIVQAFCRDILMETMLRLHDRGFRTVHRIHDELVICVPDADAERARQIAHEEMSKTPDWAPGLPLGADSKVAKRYGK